MCVLCFGLIIVAYQSYYESMWRKNKDLTIRLQENLDGKPGLTKVIEFYSGLGGGNEFICLLILSFLFGRRPKFFYYLACFTIEKSFNGFFKNAYHHPRPYMDVENIKALSCSVSMGSPSGHSTCAWFIFIMLFLDIFHGNDETFRQIQAQKLDESGIRDEEVPINSYNWCTYLLGFFVLFFWALTIPFTRIILGVHSLD